MDATNLANFEYQVALLGGPSVGKTSLMRKIINNYMVSKSICLYEYVNLTIVLV